MKYDVTRSGSSLGISHNRQELCIITIMTFKMAMMIQRESSLEDIIIDHLEQMMNTLLLPAIRHTYVQFLLTL